MYLDVSAIEIDILLVFKLVYQQWHHHPVKVAFVIENFGVLQNLLIGCLFYTLQGFEYFAF